MEFAEILDSFTSKPCDRAIIWLLTQTSLKDAWNNCNRVGWLLWVLTYSRINPRLCLSIRIAFYERSIMLPSSLINQTEHYAAQCEWLHAHNPYITPAGENKEII